VQPDFLKTTLKTLRGSHRLAIGLRGGRGRRSALARGHRRAVFRPYLAESMYQEVIESQLPHETVSFLFTTTDENIPPPWSREVTGLASGFAAGAAGAAPSSAGTGPCSARVASCSRQGWGLRFGVQGAQRLCVKWSLCATFLAVHLAPSGGFGV